LRPNPLVKSKGFCEEPEGRFRPTPKGLRPSVPLDPRLHTTSRASSCDPPPHYPAESPEASEEGRERRQIRNQATGGGNLLQRPRIAGTFFAMPDT